MIPGHRPSKILVTGRSGSGKTTFWLRYLLGARAHNRLIFDHEGELAYKLKVRPAATTQALGDSIWAGWTIFDPAVLYPGEIERAFDFFCDFALGMAARRPGRKIFGCDELQKLCGTARVSKEFCALLETGRRYGLDCALIAQQPNLIHNRIRNQLTEIVSFAQMDKNAVGWLADAGFDPDQIRALRPGEFIARSLLSGAETCGRVF